MRNCAVCNLGILSGVTCSPVCQRRHRLIKQRRGETAKNEALYGAHNEWVAWLHKTEDADIERIKSMDITGSAVTGCTIRMIARRTAP